jgi:hypothetical protein
MIFAQRGSKASRLTSHRVSTRLADGAGDAVMDELAELRLSKIQVCQDLEKTQRGSSPLLVRSLL